MNKSNIYSNCKKVTEDVKIAYYKNLERSSINKADSHFSMEKPTQNIYSFDKNSWHGGHVLMNIVVGEGT